MKSILLAAAFLGSLCWAGTNPYNIIPEPVNVTTTSGTTKNLKIIHEQKVAGLGNEGYAMKLTPGGVELRYTTPNGKAMAMATLFQLQDQLSDTPEGLPCGSIQDSPDFGWRGMMVDVGRYHYPMKEIYNFVDAMHYYKYNGRPGLASPRAGLRQAPHHRRRPPLRSGKPEQLPAGQ